MKKQEINIPPITLDWSDWHHWEMFLHDARIDKGAIRLPSKPGVYEVKFEDDSKRLTIGKASNLRKRVRQGLVKGHLPHSAGKRIRKLKDTSKIVIRWAETDRPSTVEEELHRLHKDSYGDLPKYTQRT